ncbi:MAG TPA: hypothetical protein VEX57_06475 [Microlunatus sp.]|jgi:hypothetical protein|nr:hypothetical protein [Microlunatus sp.]
MSTSTSTGRRARRRPRDAGATPVTMLLVVGILIALFAGLLTALAAVAADEGSAATHAADAAALGGARGVLDELPDQLILGFTAPPEIAGLVGGGTCLQTGRIKADELARANEATLTSYCYNVWSDEVSVAVRMRSTSVDGPPATARAEAETTFTADGCRLDPSFTEPSVEPEDPSEAGADDDDDDEPSEPLPPPGPALTWIDCGVGRQPIEFRPAVARFFFVHLADDLVDVDPRLTE